MKVLADIILAPANEDKRSSLATGNNDKAGRVNIILQPQNTEVRGTVALNTPSRKKSFREFSQSLP